MPSFKKMAPKREISNSYIQLARVIPGRKNKKEIVRLGNHTHMQIKAS